jgi:hypothetical protein
MTGYHTRWARPEDPGDDPERLAIREALAFGKALYNIRTTLGLSVAEMAMRASVTEDDIECIEEGDTELPNNPHRDAALLLPRQTRPRRDTYTPPAAIRRRAPSCQPFSSGRADSIHQVVPACS